LQLSDLRVKIGEESLPGLNVQVAFEGNGTRSQQLLEIPNLQLVINGQGCDGRGRLSHWRERPKLEFFLSSPSLKLDQLLEFLPDLESAAQAADNLSSAPGASSDESSQKSLTSRRLDRLKGLLPGMRSSPQDLKAATDKQPEPSGEPVWNWGAAVPFLMQVDAVGNIELEWLYYKRIVANKVSLQVRLQSGSFQLEPLRASFCGGQLDGALEGRLNAAGYPFRARCSLKNIMVDEITRVFMPGNGGRWSGNLTMASTASGLIRDLMSIKSRSDVLVTEADFAGHPLIDKVAELFSAEELKRLQFSQVSAGIVTNRGLITVADLYMEGSVLRMEGGGSIDPRDGEVDLRLVLRVPVQYAGKVTALGSYLPKITDEEDFTRVPLQLSGTLGKAEFRVDEQQLKQRYRDPAPKKAPEQEISKLPLKSDDTRKLQESLEKLIQ
jgi:hypothetical protein